MRTSLFLITILVLTFNGCREKEVGKTDFDIAIESAITLKNRENKLNTPKSIEGYSRNRPFYFREEYAAIVKDKTIFGNNLRDSLDILSLLENGDFEKASYILQYDTPYNRLIETKILRQTSSLKELKIIEVTEPKRHTVLFSLAPGGNYLANIEQFVSKNKSVNLPPLSGKPTPVK